MSHPRRKTATLVFIDDIQPENNSYKLKVQVMKLWKLWRSKKVVSIEMVLVDATVSTLQYYFWWFLFLVYVRLSNLFNCREQGYMHPLMRIWYKYMKEKCLRVSLSTLQRDQIMLELRSKGMIQMILSTMRYRSSLVAGMC